MKNTTIYEWIVEELAAPATATDPDIEDVTHYATFAEASAASQSLVHSRIALVRDTGNESDGLVSRLWAYVRDGKLPASFQNEAGDETNTKVPAYIAQQARITDDHRWDFLLTDQGRQKALDTLGRARGFRHHIWQELPKDLQRDLRKLFAGNAAR